MRKVILTILVSKLSIFLLIFLAYSLLPFSGPGYYFNFHYPFTAQISLQTAFSTWDAQHYLFIAQKGYHVGQESNRFFPLFPSIIKLFSPFFGYFLSGLFISSVASTIGFIYFYLLVKEFTNKEDIAYKSLILMLVFPTSFYFSIIYSEGIFLAIVMPLFYYLHRKGFLYAYLCSFLLPLVRPTGMLILFPLLFYLINDLLSNRKGLKLKINPSIFIFVPSVLGILVYFLIMQKTTGNFMTGLASHNEVVGHWQIFSIFHPQIFFSNIFPKNFVIHGFTNSIIDRIFFIIFLISLPLIWKKTNHVLFVYSVVMGFIPLFGSFMSYTRYMLLVFPLFISLGIYLSGKNTKQYLFPYIYINLILQSIFIIMHSLNYWVS